MYLYIKVSCIFNISATQAAAIRTAMKRVVNIYI